MATPRVRMASALPTVRTIKPPSNVMAFPRVATEPTRSESAVDIGAQIKALREATGASGGALARMAGISRSMLSRIERGLVSPSVVTLERIAQGLDVSVSLLFANRGRRTSWCHVPAGKGTPFNGFQVFAGGNCEALGELISGHLAVESCLVQHHENAEVEALGRGCGLKFIYVLEGRARYRYGAIETAVSKGDALLFDAAAMHGLTAVDHGPVRLLVTLFAARS